MYKSCAAITDKHFFKEEVKCDFKFVLIYFFKIRHYKVVTCCNVFRIVANCFRTNHAKFEIDRAIITCLN